MNFKTKDTLANEEIEKGLRSIINDGLSTQAMVTFTSGAFLVAFALKLGASNVLIGILAAIPFLAQLIQLPSILLVEKIRNRRAISVYSSIVSRSFFILIALIPFLFSLKLGLKIMVFSLALHSIFGGISNASWNSWMRDLIPENVLGSYFSKRMRLTTAFSIVLSIALALFLDFWKKGFPEVELYGYSMLFFAGFLAGMVGVIFLSITPEPRMVISKNDKSFLGSLLIPFKDLNFKNLLIFSVTWSFAVNLAAPFFTVYMLKRLGLGLSFIIGLTVLSQTTHMMSLKIWGKFSDRFSNKSVLGVSCPLFIFSILGWTFTTMPERYFLTLPLLAFIHIIMGIAMAGVNLASMNIGLKLAPKGEATTYLAVGNIVKSIAAGISPILGGKFADFFLNKELSWTLIWKGPGGALVLPTLNFQQWDFFFFFAFIVGLYSIHKLAAVREVGEVEEKIVFQGLISEVRREVRSLSSVGGIRLMVALPIEAMVREKKGRKRKTLKEKSYFVD